MNSALDAPALEEAEPEICRLRFPHPAFELTFLIGVEAPWVQDTAATFLLLQFGAVIACPTVDAVHLERGIAESVVVGDVAAGARDGSGGGPRGLGGT